MYYNKQRKLLLEKEDLCVNCRFSAQSKRAPCAFIVAASIYNLYFIPYEQDEDVFFVSNCGAYRKNLEVVKE